METRFNNLKYEGKPNCNFRPQSITTAIVVFTAFAEATTRSTVQLDVSTYFQKIKKIVSVNLDVLTQ